MPGRTAVAIGRIVLERLYGGSLDRWRDRGPKDGSLRRLAAALEARGARGVSASALQQAVATLDIEQRVGVTGRPPLTASHVRAVIGLPEARHELLLGTAEAKNWTAERTDVAAARERKKLATRPGRPPRPMFVKTLDRWQRELADRHTLFAGLEELDALSEADSRRMQATVAAMRDHCDALLAALARSPKRP